MTTDSAPLASPLDALYLIHNALRTEAERAEQTVEHLEVGSSFKVFQPAFYHWALVLMYLIHNALRAEAAEVTQRARQLGTTDTLAAFAQAAHQWASTLEEHARIEDTYMTPLLPARPVIQDNEAEHQRLTSLFRELASFLRAITPKTPLTPRLQRQVLRHVITLGVEHDDHLESEEDLVLPLVRQRLSEAQQCALVWRLLCAGGSQEAGTISPWIMAALPTAEQQVLATLLARWEALPRLVSCGVGGSSNAAAR